MRSTTTDESAATKEPGGPVPPVDAAWLILQRLEDLRRAQDDLRSDLKAMDAQLESLRRGVTGEVQSIRNWSLGLLLVAILSLSAKMLIPGA